MRNSKNEQMMCLDFWFEFLQFKLMTTYGGESLLGDESEEFPISHTLMEFFKFPKSGKKFEFDHTSLERFPRNKIDMATDKQIEDYQARINREYLTFYAEWMCMSLSGGDLFPKDEPKNIFYARQNINEVFFTLKEIEEHPDRELIISTQLMLFKNIHRFEPYYVR